MSESSPGPEPERLKLPLKDWKEALRRALGKERPAEGRELEDEDGEDDATQ